MSIENSGLEKMLKLRGVIREGRKIKEKGREEVRLRGGGVEPFAPYQARAETMADRMAGTYESWLDEKFEQVRDLLDNVTREEVMDAFRKGLKIYVRQEYALFESRRNGRGDEVMREDKNIKKAVISFGLEFIQLLKKSLKAGAPPRTALELASLAYIYRPDVLARYKEKYPGHDMTLLLRALIKHRSDPDGYLERVESDGERMIRKYSEFGRGLVRQVVMNYSPQEAERFLEEARRKLPVYLRKYPQLPPGLVQRAVITNPTRIDEFLGDPANFPEKYHNYKEREE